MYNAINTIRGGVSASTGQYDTIVVQPDAALNFDQVVWDISGPDSGKISLEKNEVLSDFVNDFSGIENLAGGFPDNQPNSDPNNTFMVTGNASLRGEISGGAGYDVLDKSEFTGISWTVLGGDYQDQILPGTQFLHDENTIEEVINGENASNQGLVGPSGDVAWVVSGVNTVTVNGESYDNIGHIIGRNISNDTFTYLSTGSLDGKLEGGHSHSTRDMINAPDITTETPWNITADGSGNVTFNSVATSFTGIDQLNGGSGPDVFHSEGGDTSITEIVIDIDGGNGINQYVIDTLLNGSVTGGDNGDIFTLNAPVTGAVNAGFGDDVIEVLSSVGDMTFDAGESESDADKLIISYNTGAKWTLDSGNWQVEDQDGHVNTITFANFEELEGSSYADTVTFNDVAFAGIFSGREGADTFTLARAGLHFTLHGQTDTVMLDDAVDTLINSHAETASWQVGIWGTVVSSGQTVGFTGIESVTGGSARDIIQTTKVMEQIKGGGGDDDITLHASVSHGVYGDDGSDEITIGVETINAQVYGGDRTSDTDVLTAADSDNTNYWLVGQEGAGYVENQDAEASTMPRITFFGMENLEGGSGRDEFDINALIAGTVSGFGGNDKFILSAPVSGGVYGGAGDDDFIVDQDGIALALYGQGADDSLSYAIDEGVASQWFVTGDNEGRVEREVTNGPTTTITFESVENLIGGDVIDDFTVGWSIDSITGNAGSNVYTFTASGMTAEVIGGNSVDTIEVEHAEGGTWTNTETAQSIVDGSSSPGTITFSHIERFIAGNGDDIFIVNNATSRIETRAGNDSLTTSVAITNGVNMGDDDDIVAVTQANLQFSVDGGNHTLVGDKFVGAYSAATWSLSENNGGTYSNGTASIVLSNIENLTGGTGNDVFTLGSGVMLAGVIDGGGHDTSVVNVKEADYVNEVLGDSIDASALDGANTFVHEAVSTGENHFSFTNVELLQVSTSTEAAAYDTIQSGNGVNTWVIDADDQGVLKSGTNELRFVGFQAIQGGEGDDAFAFEGSRSDYIDGRIHGGEGSGTDTLDYSLVEGVVVATLGTGSSSVEDIEGLTGYQAGSVGASYQRILLGVDDTDNSETSTWTITGENDGRFSRAGGTIYYFENFDTLVGRDNHDNFALQGAGAVTGGIIAGGGNNTLISAMNGSVDLVVQLTELAATPDAAKTLTFNDRITQISGLSSVTANASNTNTFMGYINADNVWSIDSPDSGRVNSVSFTYFGNLTGGSASDSFTFSTATTLSGLIDGAGGSSDTLNMQALADNTTVLLGSDLPESLSANIRIQGVEQINADGSGNRLIGSARNNVWTVDANNAGSIAPVQAATGENSVAFDGFGNLYGNSGDDKFIFSGTNRVNGVVVGGSHSVDGGDELDLSGVTLSNNAGIVVGVLADGERLPIVGADFSIAQFETLEASAAAKHSLQAANQTNEWLISGENTGSLNGMNFSHFANLTGNSNVDTFIFQREGNITGHVTGTIDGGDEPSNLRDTVDMSTLDFVSVTLSASGDSNGVLNIERLVGNDSDSHIHAGNGENNWNITAENEGTLTATNTDIAFEDFNYLHGGAGEDHFTVTGGGSVEGEIAAGAGAGADTLTVTVAEGANGKLVFNGGDQSDSVTVNGGYDGLIVEYTPQTTGDDESRLAYTNANGDNYNIDFLATETVTDYTAADSLIIRDTAATDNIVLNGNTVTVVAGKDFTFDDKDNLRFEAESDDTITLQGNVALDGQLAIENASVVSANGANIVAESLLLDSTGRVGSADARLRVDVNDLLVDRVDNAIYLQDANQINLAGIDTTSTLDIVAGSHISDSANITLQGQGSALVLTALDGNVVLDSNNALGGIVSVTAQEGTTTLNTTGRLALAVLTTENATLNAGGNITSSGVVMVSDTLQLDAAGNIELSNVDNQLGTVQVQNADNVSLINQGILNLAGASVSGNLQTVSNGLRINGEVEALSADVNAGGGYASINSSIVATNNLTVAANGVDVMASVSALDVSIQGGNGIVNVDGSVTATGGKTVIVAQTVNQNANVSGSLGVEIRGVDGVYQGARISGGDVVVAADNGAVTMAADVSTTGKVVEYSAADKLTLSNIKAASLNASGTAVNQNGTVQTTGATEISGQQFVMSSRTQLTAESVSINAVNTVTLEQVTSVQDLRVVTNGRVTAQNLLVSNNGGVTLQGNGIALNGVVRGQTVTVNDTSGGISVASPVNATGDIIVRSVNADVVQSGVIESTGGNITVSGGGDVTMSALADTSAAGGVVAYSAGGSTSVNRINNATGTISLTAENGEVTAQSQGYDIVASRLEVDAETGIQGSVDGVFNAAVDRLFATNGSGEIVIKNSKEITVERLRNNGNIDLVTADGDIVIDNLSDNTYFGPRDPKTVVTQDIREMGGVINANFHEGTVKLTPLQGNIVGLGVADVRQPDVVAANAILTPSKSFGQIGTGVRPIVMLVKDVFDANAKRIYRSWGYGYNPRTYNAGGADIDPSSALNLAAEQLIDVEEMEDIDPAIFTAVSNYFFDDVSIRLPNDQLYEDELEEYANQE